MKQFQNVLKQLEGLKVLYVEDDLQMQKQTKTLLENFFTEIAVASNGVEALELYKKYKYELVISDIDMPVMNGLEMAREIKQINKKQSIVFITAFNDTEYLLETIKLCIDGYILKPFTLEQVQETLFRVTQGIVYQKENHAYYERLEREVQIRTQELEISKDELKKEHNRLEAIFQTSRDGVALLDLQTNFLDFNDAYLEFTGFTKEELLAQSCLGLSVEEDKVRTREIIEEVKVKGFVENFEKSCVVKDGKRITVNMSLALMPNKQEIIASTRDVTQDKKTRQEIEKYLRLIDQNIIMSSTDLAGNITDVSQAFCETCGYSKEELIGGNYKKLRSPDVEKSFYKDMWRQLLNDEVYRGEIKNIDKAGKLFWVDVSIFPKYDERDKKIGYTSIRHNVTDKKNIELLSITDPLTSLYNRRYFERMFSKIINGAKRENKLVCFMILDVDNFKLYNDSFGHMAGDDVLIKVAKSILNTLRRADDYAFRLGGEEFGVIFHAKSKEDALTFTKNIQEGIYGLKIEHAKDAAYEYVSASIGLGAKRGNEIGGFDNFYKEVDDLLYKAKMNGRNRIESL